MTFRDDGTDPRRSTDADGGLESLGPIVGRAAGRGGAIVTVAGFSAAAVGLFLVLNSHRQHVAQPSLVPASAQEVSAGQAVAPPPPLRLPAPPPPVAPSLPVPAPVAAVPPPPLAAAPPAVAPPPADAMQRQHAPAVVVDMGGAGGEPPKVAASGAAPAVGAGAGAPLTPSPLTAGANGQPGAEDQFAERLEDAAPAKARATAMGNLGNLVPQGAIIPAVLETAINSDLPGYTRAVVSRDVRGFDGRTVLIPRGSRLIGQYKSAVALGASRAFVIWTRVIRPDGVSIQIGSPGTDPLGRAGLTGEVNRHFFTRFGGSILLSVLNAGVSAGVAAVSRTPTTSISIGSPTAAAGAASAIQPDAIPPTIKVAEGSAINIFVSRDLDFSGVKPVK
jgi:type IV secretion system protein VirB10